MKRDAATRRDLLYDGFDHRATATATHLSLAVREARARRLAEWKGWTAEELEGRLAAEQAEAAAGEEFLLVFYTPNMDDNDLDAPKSVWHLAVKSEDGELVSNRATGVYPDAELRKLFPWVGPFDTVYRVSFPKPAGGPLAGRRVRARDRERPRGARARLHLAAHPHAAHPAGAARAALSAPRGARRCGGRAYSRSPRVSTESRNQRSSLFG